MFCSFVQYSQYFSVLSSLHKIKFRSVPLSVFHVQHILCRRPAGPETLSRQDTAGEQHLPNREDKDLPGLKEICPFTQPSPVLNLYTCERIAVYACVRVLMSIMGNWVARVAVWIEIERRRLMAQAKMYAWLEKLIKLKLCYDE